MLAHASQYVNLFLFNISNYNKYAKLRSIFHLSQSDLSEKCMLNNLNFLIRKLKIIQNVNILNLFLNFTVRWDRRFECRNKSIHKL